MEILVAEDNALARRFLVSTLEQEGYRVEAVEDGEAAWEWSQHSRPDLVVADVLMPRMDGFGLRRRFQADERLRQVPFIFYSGTFVDEADRELAADFGAIDYIVKTADTDEFLARIAESIAKAPSAEVTPSDPGRAEQAYRERLIEKLHTKVDQLERREREFRRTVEAIPDILFSVTMPALDLVYVSPAVQELLGAVPEELYGDPQSWRRHVDERDRDMLFEEIARAQGEFQGLQHSFRMWHRDGKTLRWFDAKATVERDETGRATHLHGILVDTARRRRAEDVAASRERELHTLLGNLPGMAYRCLNDREWSMEFVSGGAYKLTGYRPDDLIDNRVVGYEQLIHPDDRELVRDAVDASLPTQGRFQVGYRLVDRNGDVHWVWEQGIAVGRRGETELLEGFVTDITEQRQTQSALAESEKRYRTIVETAQEGIWQIAPDGTTVFVNRRMGELLGYDGDGMVGRNLKEFVAEQDRPRLEQKLERRRHGVSEKYDFPFVHSDGHAVWMSISTNPLYNREGELIGALGMLSDVTDRRAMEEQLRDMARFPAENPDAVMRVDEAFRLTYANESATALMAQMGGVEGRLPAPWREHIEQAWAQDGRYEFETDVGEACFAIVVAPIRGARYTNLYARDVTQRKRAQAALSASEGRFRELFEKMLDAFAIHEVIRDAAGRVVDYRFLDVNPAFEEHTGLARETVVGHTAIEILPDLEPQWLARFGTVATTGEAVRFEQYTAALERTFEVVAFCPGPDQFATVFSDITERKHSERSLSRLNRALRTLSRANEALVRVSDEDDLEQSVCRILVNEGGYSAAVIAEVSENVPRILALTGIDADVVLPLLQGSVGNNPVVAVMTEGRTSVVTADDGRFQSWSDHLLEAGRNAAVLVPLRRGERQLGVLALFSDTDIALDEDEFALLDELAFDLAFGIDSRRLEKDHEERGRRLQHAILQTIMAISTTLEKRDPYTAGHQERVARLSMAIGHRMGLSAPRLEGIYLGGLIHDIGKVYVPAEILSRPGRLSSVEYSLVQTHAMVGYDIIKDVDFPWPIAEMVRQHHERLDGSGYPDGLEGEAIVLEARIMAVADVVEAMASHRPYRPGLGLDLALAEIKQGRGTLFDTAVVDACTALFEDDGFSIDDAPGLSSLIDV